MATPLNSYEIVITYLYPHLYVRPCAARFLNTGELASRGPSAAAAAALKHRGDLVHTEKPSTRSSVAVGTLGRRPWGPSARPPGTVATLRCYLWQNARPALSGP